MVLIIILLLILGLQLILSSIRYYLLKRRISVYSVILGIIFIFLSGIFLFLEFVL